MISVSEDLVHLSGCLYAAIHFRKMLWNDLKGVRTGLSDSSLGSQSGRIEYCWKQVHLPLVGVEFLDFGIVTETGRIVG